MKTKLPDVANGTETRYHFIFFILINLYTALNTVAIDVCSLLNYQCRFKICVKHPYYLKYEKFENFEDFQKKPVRVASVL